VQKAGGSLFAKERRNSGGWRWKSSNRFQLIDRFCSYKDVAHEALYGSYAPHWVVDIDRRHKLISAKNTTRLASRLLKEKSVLRRAL
jgi:hypothetical protein